MKTVVLSVRGLGVTILGAIALFALFGLYSSQGWGLTAGETRLE